MKFNYTLKYRTFDNLIDDVMVDFKSYTLEDMIEPATLITVVRKMNYELGLRIHKTNEVVLEIEHGKAKLPDNFKVFNHALICTERTVNTGYDIGGTHITEVPYVEVPPNDDNCAEPVVNGVGCDLSIPTEYNKHLPFGQTCNSPRVFVNCKGQSYELIQIISPSKTAVFKQLLPLKMRPNPDIDCDCPNLYYKAADEGWINHGFLNTNFDTGNVYLNYQSYMEDEEGNLLVPDHELLNEYYEYGVKRKILETLFMEDENVGKKLEFIEQRYREARNKAMSLVNTPNFEEMRKTWEANRKASYAKYYDMFRSIPNTVNYGRR
jgi:hypothetical protein